MRRFEQAPTISPEEPGESSDTPEQQYEHAAELPSPLTGQEVMDWAKRNHIGREVVRPPGNLITQGQESDAVYVILSPTALVEYHLNGKAYHLAALPPGSVAGEISALSESMPTASVRLAVHTRLLEIPKDEFRSITNDPALKERVEVLIRKRLLASAAFQQKLATYFEEREAERMHETPNKELREKLNFNAAMEAGLAQGIPQTYDFKIAMMLGSSLETEDFSVRYREGNGGEYQVDVYTGDTIIPITFSADGKEAGTGKVEMGDLAGAGFYSRILRYLLQGVEHVEATITEDNTVDFLKKDRTRDPQEIAHSELAANSPVVAARKGFISNIDSKHKLDSYRVDKLLALMLDISTDLERALLEGTDKRLIDIYGATRETTLYQVRDEFQDYRQSDEYGALSDDARSLCDLQFERIAELSRIYLPRNENTQL